MEMPESIPISHHWPKGVSKMTDVLDLTYRQQTDSRLLGKGWWLACVQSISNQSQVWQFVDLVFWGVERLIAAGFVEKLIVQYSPQAVLVMLPSSWRQWESPESTCRSWVLMWKLRSKLSPLLPSSHDSMVKIKSMLQALWIVKKQSFQ